MSDFNYRALKTESEAILAAMGTRRGAEVRTYDKLAENLGRDDVVQVNGELWLVDDIRSVLTLGSTPFTEYTLLLSQPLDREKTTELQHDEN